MVSHEYCLIDDQPLEWCTDPDQCRRATELLVKYRELLHLSPYLTGWIPRGGCSGYDQIYYRGEWEIRLIGKRDIRLTGKGFTGEMRFYEAAKKVMEIENG